MGWDVDDYRLLGPYLKNPFIMAHVIKQLSGQIDVYSEKNQKVSSVKSAQTIQVVCEDLICRRESREQFLSRFPLSTGSSGLETDLTKLYCDHFRYQDYSGAQTIPKAKEWIKEAELEDPVFETNFFISFLTGIPDPLFGLDNFVDLALLLKSSIDERWEKWAKDILSHFSKDLLFEESLKIKTVPFDLKNEPKDRAIQLKFLITLGEMDRILDHSDKLKSSFTFKIPKNYFIQFRYKWNDLVNEIDLEGQEGLKKDFANYLDLQLKQKEKYFLQKIWNKDFSRIMAEELINQVLVHKGTLFDNYGREILEVPVEFNYGLFALSYLRYRADVNADRLKFKY